MSPPVCSNDDECLNTGEYCVNASCRLPPWGYIDPHASCEEAKQLLNQKGFEICLGYEGTIFSGCWVPKSKSQWDWCKDPNAQKGFEDKQFEWSRKVILHHCGNEHGVTPCACSCPKPSQNS